MVKKNPIKQRKPSVGKGGVPTPPGFEAHPERRHNGAWKKEDTPRYKLEQMMKLTEPELKQLASDNDAPLFERKLAQCINRGDWKAIEGMINQVYGMPKQPTEELNREAPIIIDMRSKDDSNNDRPRKNKPAE
jgi:hypothetical protein